MRRFLICCISIVVAACNATGVDEKVSKTAPKAQSPASPSIVAPEPAAPPPPVLFVPPPPPPAPSPAYVVQGAPSPGASNFQYGLSTAKPDVIARRWVGLPSATPPFGNREQFPDFQENAVKRAADEPVSTFSVDVDTASYAIVRRDLQGGRLPNPDSVRIEELINYFPYDYPTGPSESTPFSTSVAILPTPWNDNTRLMHIGLRGYEPPVAERPDANLVLLIDTSGSMRSDDKLPLLIKSFLLFLEGLEPQDRVSIVTYAGSTGVALEPTPVSEREKIELALRGLTSGGGTAGGAGLNLAYAQAEAGFIEGGINRIFLATDGDFNIGPSGPDAIKDLITEKRQSGVFLSVLGFGQYNLNDQIMQALAQKGNGTAAYIDTLSEARKVLVEDASRALVPIASDVKVQVEFNPARVAEYRLIGYETRALNREDFNNDAVDAGDINSGHTVTAIYEITPVGSDAVLIDPLRYQPQPLSNSTASDEYAFLKLRYKRPGDSFSTLIDRPVRDADVLDNIDTASDEVRFSVAVTGFAQILRKSAYLGDSDFDRVEALAKGALGPDPFGYRNEFTSLVRLARDIERTQ